MSEDKRTRPSKQRGRREKEKRALKPEPLPIRARSDIFASTEATHLLDRPDVTSILNTIDVEDQDSAQAPDKTQLLNIPESKNTRPRQSPRPDADVLPQASKAASYKASNLQTQILQINTSEDEKSQSVDEHTRMLDAKFDESEERTGFFDAHDGLAMLQAAPSSRKTPDQKPPPVSSTPKIPKDTAQDMLVDPRPRRSGEASGDTRDKETARQSDGPTPSPRKSRRSSNRSSTPENLPSARPSQPRPSADAAIPSPRKSQGEQRARRPKDRSSEEKRESPSAKPLNLGVFADDSTHGQEDVIGQVVEKSWKELPKSPPSSTELKRANTDKTKTLWIRISLGFILLVAVGFLFRSEQPQVRNVQKARSTSVAKPLYEHISSMALALPLSKYARKVRPGTNIFLMGRQGVLLLIEGGDQSKFIHHDSLARTLENSRTLATIQQQLSGVKTWPSELAIGIDQLTSISVVRRLCAALNLLGVQRVSFLTDTKRGNEIGELRLDVSDKLGRIPAAGALELNVASSTIALALLTPKQPSKKLATFDAFTPNLHQKIDQQIDTFTFENPRITRAFIRVPEGLRLSQTVELAKSLVRDERMTRVTVVTQPSDDQGQK